MDQITEDAVQRIVEALIEDQAMFSLHDVTTLARKDNLTVKHYGHGGVRDFVNGLLQSPMFADYNATSNGQFNIFHHYEDDVYDYDQNEHRAASPAAAPNSTVPITTGTVSLSTLKPAFVAPTTPVDDGKIAPDQRGRLCVRAAMLRKLGVKPGDEVCIDIEPADEERALITVDGIHPGVPICLKVDKDNCLRISRGTLGEIFETLPSSFKVEFVTDAIGGNCIVLE